MRTKTYRKAWIVLIAVLLLFTACKGESPTAPPSGSPGNPPTTPPTGVNIALSVSNPEPVVGSFVTITAKVTKDGVNVPNGTAIEFETSGGFLDTSSTRILKTTTDGVATVRLNSAAAGPIRVTATVSNVSNRIDVTYRPTTNPPEPPDTSPAITGVTPSVGRPTGGQVVRITGRNFKPPVRVLFDINGTLTEAFVNGVNDAQTEIEVVTPAVNLGAGQSLAVDVIVITQAGTTTEARADLVDGFTFRNQSLTPVIFTVTPNSGPVTGGTIAIIKGEGFQEPVQVLFNTAEVRVLHIEFDEIQIETPAARDTAPTGSGTVVGPVAVTVRNLDSNTTDTMDDGFFYKAAMQITAVGPTQGLYTGGTRVTIDGVGFLPPVAVTVAGVAAQPIFVSGTKIIVLTPAVQIEGCADRSGIISVTNVNNGDSADGPEFAFVVPPPAIVDINPSVATEGVTPSITVTVANAQPGVNRIRIGDRTVFPTSVDFNDDGTADFVVPLPTNFDFPTEECGVNGERPAPIDLDVTYENANTDCEDTATDALTVNPQDNTCVEPPAPEANILSPASTSCPGLQINTVDGTTPNSGTITMQNTGTGPLTVTAAASPAQFTVLPANASIPPGGTQNFTVTFTPAGADAIGNVAFTTDDPDEATINVCVTGNVP